MVNVGISVLSRCPFSCTGVLLSVVVITYPFVVSLVILSVIPVSADASKPVTLSIVSFTVAVALLLPLSLAVAVPDVPAEAVILLPSFTQNVLSATLSVTLSPGSPENVMIYTSSLSPKEIPEGYEIPKVNFLSVFAFFAFAVTQVPVGGLSSPFKNCADL